MNKNKTNKENKQSNNRRDDGVLNKKVRKSARTSLVDPAFMKRPEILAK